MHCDIKPDNILFGSQDLSSKDSKILYLIDFGISKKFADKNGNHLEQ